MRIERLVLHTGPMSEAQARELAQQVAEELTGLPLRPTGAVTVSVPAPGDARVPTLRDAIVRAVSAALAEGVATEPNGAGR
ncbi:MAG: hypothetical protein WAS07_14460 [Micropruina sp.]|nr:hypothetical protein [Micropruina sp.]